MKHKAYEIKHWDTDWQVVKDNYVIWTPCRPENYKFESFITRVKHAWGVLTGRYDVLDWEV